MTARLFRRRDFDGPEQEEEEEEEEEEKRRRVGVGREEEDGDRTYDRAITSSVAAIGGAMVEGLNPETKTVALAVRRLPTDGSAAILRLWVPSGA